MSTESNHPIVVKPRINAVAQYLLTLATVIAVYSGYLKFAVPRIEGPANQVVARKTPIPLDQLPSPREKKSHLIPLLPPDAWELEACTTLLIDAGTILYTSQEQLDDGSLLIKPFTLISGLENGSSDEPSSQPPTVLRCLSGAKLKFNKPFGELFHGKAKMVSAQLIGQVDIYRPPTKPDQSDAVHFVTSNVQIDKHRVYTLEAVEFDFGASHGSGRNMLIDLAHEDEASALAGFSNISGIRRLEIAFLDKIRIESSTQEIEDNAGSRTEANQMGREPTAKKALFSSNKSPLEITCQGPFVFDFKSKTASFSKQVVVEQINGFKDNIQCDELALIFGDKSKANLPPDTISIQPKARRKPEGGKLNMDLQLERLIAKGSPAIVVSHSQSAQITGEYLSYNLMTNQIDGRSRPNRQAMVEVVSPEYRMVAKQLTYQMADDGSLGEIDATGPGQLIRVGSPEQDAFDLVWKKSLTTRNASQQPNLLQIVVDGSALIRVAQQTSIQADRLEMLVWKIPKQAIDPNDKAKRSWEYRPSKLFTSGDVIIFSPQLDGETNHLTASWPTPRQFQQSAFPKQAIQRVGYRGTIQHQTNQRARQTNSNNDRQLARIPGRSANIQTQTGSTNQNVFKGRTASANPTGFVEQPATPQQTFVRNPHPKAVGFTQQPNQPKRKPTRKLKFKAETVDVRLVDTDGSTEIRDLTVVGNISIVSVPIEAAGLVPGADANQRPLTIAGHRLQLTPQPKADNYRCLVSGKNGGLATILAKDLELEGQNINLDQTANKVWVEGTGSLNLKTTPKEKPPENLNVSWSGGMIFDGSKVYFEHDVEMATGQTSDDGKTSSIQSLSEGLSVELSKPVQFQNLQSDEKVSGTEIRELIFVDQVPKSKQVFKVVKLSTQPEQAIARPVVIQNQTYNTNGELSEQQKIAVPKAVINMEKNTIESRGPGSISTHRQSKPSTGSAIDPFARLANQGQRKEQGQEQGPAQNDAGITFIQINFDGKMQVDTVKRTMTLDRNIRTIYSPVQNWSESFNPDDVLQRAPGRVFMTCEKLLLAQWVPRGNEKGTSEIIATGNAHVFSSTFDATADRVSYDQADDILVIVGTQRTDANLLFKQTPNDKTPIHLVAHQITYRLKDQATQTFGLESLGLNRK